jgi:hypothetical protein
VRTGEIWTGLDAEIGPLLKFGLQPLFAGSATPAASPCLDIFDPAVDGGAAEILSDVLKSWIDPDGAWID